MRLRARLGALPLVGFRRGVLRRPAPVSNVGVVLAELFQLLLHSAPCLLAFQLRSLLTP